VAHKFGTLEPTRTVVISRELVFGRLSSVFGPETIFWQLHIKDDRDVETVMRRWLITKDTD